MKKYFLPAVAVMCAVQMYAYTERTERMTVELNDGSTVEYNVEDIKLLSFSVDVANVAFSITTPGGEEEVKMESIPSVLRVTPTADSGDPYGFAFGMVTAENASDLLAGKYAVEFNITQTMINNGEVALGGSEASSASVRLYTYAEGAVESIMETVTEGTLSTAIDRKTKKVTFELNATFEDGTVVRASYEGTVVDVESLEGLNPAPVFSNELYYYNADGVEAIHANITGVKRDQTSSGWARFTFSFDNASASKCQIEMPEQYFGQALSLPEAPQNSVNFRYGAIQLSGPNDQYRNAGNNGTVLVKDNGDGTFTFSVDVTNTYNTAWGTVGGTPERVVLDYTGTVEN